MLFRSPSGGALRFLRPDGRSFDSVAPEHTRPLCDAEALQAVHEQQGIVIDKKTATTRWRGEKMDYGLAIDVLLQHAKRAPGVSAETRRPGGKSCHLAPTSCSYGANCSSTSGPITGAEVPPMRLAQ